MASAQILTLSLARRAQRLQLLTVLWMTAEAVITLAAAGWARSPALLGFGADSAIELLSATALFWRFRAESETESMRAEKTAARIAGALLFFLAGFVMITSALALMGYEEPRPSAIGIGVL